LVGGADPEERLGLAAHVTERLVELRRTLKEDQLVRIFVTVLEEPPRIPTSQRGT
jgi:hypothetical protein